MERVFRLTGDLGCMRDECLPKGTLVLEPRCVGRDKLGADWVFLASQDGGESWQEYRTVIEDLSDWFELVEPPPGCEGVR